MSLPDPRLQNGYSGNLLTKGKLLKINSNCTCLCQKLSVLTRQIPSPMQPQVEQARQRCPEAKNRRVTSIVDVWLGSRRISPWLAGQ